MNLNQWSTGAIKKDKWILSNILRSMFGAVPWDECESHWSLVCTPAKAWLVRCLLHVSIYIPIALSLVYLKEKYKSTIDSFDEVLFDRDGIHLSHEGNKIVAQEILKVLREADWEPSLHWNSMPTEFAEDSLYDPNGADERVL